MGDSTVSAPSLDDMREAAIRLAPHTLRTPLLRFNRPDGAPPIYLKPENLQPVGAFKNRPIGNVLLSAASAALRDGAYTASSGNSGLALAWMARRIGIAATLYAPASAPANKLDRATACGARVCSLDDEAWWEIMKRQGHPAEAGFYVDAVRNTAALAGNATIGLEIVEQLPDVDTIIVPFGGGGIACGIAAAIREVKPDTRIVVAESDAATPASAAFEARRPVPVDFKSSFISGAGAPSVLPEMWPLVDRLVDDTRVVAIAGVADAIRQLFVWNRIVAEGAGAIPLAAALANADALTGKTVCLVSGGNIDSATFGEILNRERPSLDGGD